MKDKKQRDKLKIKISLEYGNNIIATLREPFLVLDKNLKIISSNQAFYTTFKVAETETIGQALPDLGNNQWNIPKLLQLLKEIISKKKVVKDYEVKHKFEHIGERTMILNACQVSVSKRIAGITAASAKEKEELIMLAIEDITEHKRLEKELKESEERYRRAFETSRDGLLLVHKTKADILNSNESVQELLGYSHEELLKKKLWEIGVTKDHEDFHKMISEVEKDGVIHYEDMLVKPKKNLSIKSEVFLVDKAKVLQCNIRNITERKKSEEALKESETRFKAIFNESLDGMLLADIETKQLFMCNPRICQMLGYTEEEFVHMKAYDIHPEKDLPFVIQQFERQAKGDVKIAESLPMKRKDGSIFFADVNASPIILSYKKYLMGTFRDITEHKQAEDALREAIKIKTDFTGMVSHELRTPLTAIKEGISVVLDKITGNINEDQAKYLNIVKNNVDRLNRLITKVLDFQSLESGKIEFNIEEGNMNEIIKGIQNTMMPSFNKKGLYFELNLCDNIPQVNFDRDKIIQVLTNLVNNVLKFTEKGGIVISTSKEDNFIKVIVKDTGIGIKKENIPKLFQEFTQLQRKAGGTGLGLSICEKIIEAHKGKIWADSEFGSGTAFCFTLPIKNGRK